MMLIERCSLSSEALTPVNGDVARLALLGSGTVGLAVLRRLAQWQGSALGAKLRLVFAANTRLAIHDEAGLDPLHCAALLPQASSSERRSRRADALEALGKDGIRILIDATADAETASSHAECLSAGVHVATACKLAAGTSLDQWRAIRDASARNGAGFGDRATVGAGLPLLRSIRELRAGGDRIHAIAGVMSGSLAWLFHNFDGSRPFSDLVREARDSGFTEPDPREDLSGEDVRRKILILARAAGFEIDSDQVEVGSLVPPELAALAPPDVDAALGALDAPMAERLARARFLGCGLRFVARLEGGTARVGLETLCPGDPLHAGGGTDNRVAIWSDRYRDQPLIIQGPGAGPEVTAAALLDDVLQLRAFALGIPLAA
jgi:homoserine dehydrogenase